MDTYSAVNTFVPLWIFVPMILVGIVGLFTTPKPSRNTDQASRSFNRPQSDVQPRKAYAM